MTPPEEGRRERARIRNDLQKMLKSGASKEKIAAYLSTQLPKLRDVIFAAAKKSGNAFAKQIISGARGNPQQLSSLLGSDLMYLDHKDRPLADIPILHNYAEGLDPWEYWASTYGARKGTLCLDASTPVLMADYSVKTIAEVRVGDRVMGADRSGKMHPVRVLDKYDNGIQPVFRWTFRRNSNKTFVELLATENHKVLAEIREGRPGSTYARRSVYEPTLLPLSKARMQTNPHKNTFVAMPSIGEWGNHGVHEDRALLLGLMLGDGCMAPSAHGSYTFSCADPQLLEDVKEYLAGFNLQLRRTCSSQYGYSLSEIEPTKRRVVRCGSYNCFAEGHLNETKTWLREIAGECLAHEKTIPEEVYLWDDESVGHLLGGLFSTDGTVARRKDGISIRIASTSLAMLKQIQRLLELRLGIWCSDIHCTPASKKQGAKHDLYHLSINHKLAVLYFYQRVHLVGRKRRTLDEAMQDGSGGYHNNAEYGFKIHTKTFLGYRPTYDIEVDHPDHAFVLANGLVVSNSTKFATRDAGAWCLAAGTLVQCWDGTAKPIEQVKPGDHIIGVGLDRVGRVCRVNHVFDNGPRQCYRYTFHDGSSSDQISLVATPEHKVLAELHCGHTDRYKDQSIYTPTLLPLGTAGMTKSKKDISFVASSCLGWESNTNCGTAEPQALLLGLLLGDGCLTDEDHVTFYCADTQLLTDIQSYLASLNLHLVKKNGYNDYEYDLQWLCTIGRQVRQKHPFKQWLRTIGVYGCKAHEKKIPDVAYTWNNASIASLLAGLFATDGHINSIRGGKSCNVWLSSTALGMLERVQILLRRLGIISRIYSKKNGNGHLGTLPVFVLTISHREMVRRFHDMIPLVGKKRRELSLIVGKWDDAIHPFGYRIIKAEPVGTQNTYDLEVDHPDHIFLLANGLCVSNSKHLGQSVHDLVVTQEDCKTKHGLTVPVDDEDSIGGVLAAPVGPFKAGQVITGRVLSTLAKAKISEVPVRSVSTCEAEHGVCAACSGIREHGRFPRIGENVGLPASQSFGEKLSQTQLCLAEGTLVRMVDGSSKPIETISVGDWVFGSNEQGQLRPVQVKTVYVNGLKFCRRHIFARYKGAQIYLDATDDHKILACSYTGNDSLSQYNGTPRQIPLAFHRQKFSAVLPAGCSSDTMLLCEPRALLLGLMIGDGCAKESVGGTYFSCGDPSLIPPLNTYLASLNLKAVKLKGQKYYYRISQIQQASTLQDKNGRFVGGDRNPCKVFLKSMGIWDCYAHEKKLPDVVHLWDNDSLSHLLAGLFITDGSFYLGNRKKTLYASFTSTCETLIQQVQDILLFRFGVYSQKYTWAVKPNSYMRRPLYELKIRQAASVLRLVEALPLLGKKLQRVRQHAKTLHADRAYTLLRRIRVEDIGLKMTYDLEVDHPDHLFVLANGLIVSNSSKHSGGVAGQGSSVSGFKAFEQMIQFPKKFLGGAVLAKHDGRVQTVEEAPAGGWFVTLNNEQHYVPAGRQLLVKPGQLVEQGDSLSDGIPSPAEVAAYKGLGHARRAFIQSFYDLAKSSGMPAHRRNVEVLARGLLRYVSMDEPHGDWLPGDVVDYNQLRRNWTPPEDSEQLEPKKAVGYYAMAPIGHLEIGDRINKQTAEQLATQYPKTPIWVRKDPPPFKPYVVRALEHVSYADNWLARMGGSYLKRSLLDAVGRGQKAPIHSTSYIGSYAYGTEFGKDIQKTGLY